MLLILHDLLFIILFSQYLITMVWIIKPKEFILDFVKRCNEVGAVVSIDIGVYRDGKYDPIQVEALKYLNENL